jgi:glycosyltransferase involved in cell wall biosynthesis
MPTGAQSCHHDSTEFRNMTARLSLTMIVKNEAATLGRCLASVLDLVDEIIVVDIGSSDHSKHIAQQHDARVFHLPWPDSFAAARNESIRQAAKAEHALDHAFTTPDPDADRGWFMPCPCCG